MTSLQYFEYQLINSGYLHSAWFLDGRTSTCFGLAACKQGTYTQQSACDHLI